MFRLDSREEGQHVLSDSGVSTLSIEKSVFDFDICNFSEF